MPSSDRAFCDAQRGEAHLTEPLGLLLATVRRVMLPGRGGAGGCACRAAALAAATMDPDSADPKQAGL